MTKPIALRCVGYATIALSGSIHNDVIQHIQEFGFTYVPIIGFIIAFLILILGINTVNKTI